MITTTRHTRFPDWPPALHAAADAMEAGADRLVRADNPDEMSAALMAAEHARAAFGRELLALDKIRRAAFYDRYPKPRATP